MRRDSPRPSAGRHEVPFELVSGIVVVPVELDGIDRALWFMLDTGAPTVLPPALAAELGVQGGETISGTDAAGVRVESVPVVLPGLRIGDLHMKDVGAVVSPIPIPEWLCHPIDGVLGVGLMPGTGFLDRFAVEIDYAKERLVIAEPGARLTEGGTSLPLRRTHLDEHGKRIIGTVSEVWVVVEGERGWVTFDSGYNGDVSLSEGLFAQLGRSLDEEGLVTRRGLLTVSASGAQVGLRHEGRLRSLELGSLHLTEIPVAIESQEGAGFDTMLLGYGLLRHFTVIVDYPHDEVRLVPVQGSDPREIEPELGFMWDEVDGKIAVVAMLTDGPAERAGIALGDEVRELVGVAVTAGDPDLLCEVMGRMDRMDEDAPVSVRLRRGDRTIAVDLRQRPTLPPIRE